MLNRSIDRRALQRLEVRRQSRRLYCCALHGGNLCESKGAGESRKISNGISRVCGVVGLSWFDDSRGRWAGPRGCILASRWMRCWAKALATRLWRCWGSVGVELHVEAVVMAKYES
jgi:hypothetical protein